MVLRKQSAVAIVVIVVIVLQSTQIAMAHVLFFAKTANCWFQTIRHRNAFDWNLLYALIGTRSNLWFFFVFSFFVRLNSIALQLHSDSSVDCNWTLKSCGCSSHSHHIHIIQTHRHRHLHIDMRVIYGWPSLPPTSLHHQNRSQINQIANINASNYSMEKYLWNFKEHDEQQQQ